VGRSASLDESSITNLGMKADMERLLGREDAARATLAECVRRAPTSLECLMFAATFATNHGDCEQLSQLARQYVAAAPDEATGYYYRAAAEASLGAAPETVQ